jgi:hypothetical protein
MAHLVLSILLWAHPYVFHGGNHMVTLQEYPQYAQFKSFRQYNGPTNDDYQAGEIVGINVAIFNQGVTAPGSYYCCQGFIPIEDFWNMLYDML